MSVFVFLLMQYSFLYRYGVDKVRVLSYLGPSD